MYTEPDSIGDSYVRNISGTKQQKKKKILNVHIENWIIMELPSKMNSELESNNPPSPTFANTLFPIFCLSKFFEGVSVPPLFMNDATYLIYSRLHTIFSVCSNLSQNSLNIFPLQCTYRIL